MSRPFPAWLARALVLVLLVQSLAPATLLAGARPQQVETVHPPDSGK